VANFDNIGEYGLGQALARRLTTPGGAVAPTVAPELFPVICLENDRPEMIHLANGGLYGRRLFISAVVGQYGMAQLYIPSNRNTIAVVENIRSVNAATSIVIARGVGISAGLGGWTGQTTASRDFRARQEGSGAILETNANVATPTVYAQIDVLETINHELNSPVVIVPGTALLIWGAVANAIVSFSIQWRERMAQPGELL